MGAGKRYLLVLLVLCFVLSLAVPAAAAENGQTKYAAITFDDGPNTTYTPKLLDELKLRNVKCTFFVLGMYAEKHPEVVKRAYDEGHQIASHTYYHNQLPKLTDQQIVDDVEKTRALLESITGQHDFMLRIPYGYYTSRVRTLVEAPIVLWSVDGTNGDVNYTTKSLTDNSRRQMHDGAIVLFHDTSYPNLTAALSIIDTLSKQGYTFVTVEELFRIKGVKAENSTVYHNLKTYDPSYDEERLEEHWAYDSIADVQKSGIMQGDQDGFGPNEYMTRAMAVTAVWNACGKPEFPGISGFEDVPEDAWYAEAVNWTYKKRIIFGVTEKSFAPDELMTREQFCALIARVFARKKVELAGAVSPRAYGDIDKISPWALEGVNMLLKAGFVSQNDMSVFRPLDNITRAEAAELLSWYTAQTEKISD